MTDIIPSTERLPTADWAFGAVMRWYLNPENGYVHWLDNHLLWRGEQTPVHRGDERDIYGRFKVLGSGDYLRAHRAAAFFYDGTTYDVFSSQLYEEARRNINLIGNNSLGRARVDACHKCEFKMCLNPAHLYLGTPQSNALDKPPWSSTTALREDVADRKAVRKRQTEAAIRSRSLLMQLKIGMAVLAGATIEDACDAYEAPVKRTVKAAVDFVERDKDGSLSDELLLRPFHDDHKKHHDANGDML